MRRTLIPLVVGLALMPAPAASWQQVSHAPQSSAQGEQLPPVREIADVSAIGSSVRWLRVHPDGRRYVMTVVAGGDAWVLDRSDGSLRRVEVPGPLRNPVWSPSTGDLAFSRRDEQGRVAVWTAADAGRGAPRRLSVVQANDPVYSPDGAWLTYNRLGFDCEDGRTGPCEPALVVVPVRGGPEREVGLCCSFPVAWSGDGRWIYYHRFNEDGPGYDFERAPAAGGPPQRLFSIGTDEHHEVGLSPDGRYLGVVFRTPSGGGWLNTLAMWTADGRELFRREMPQGATALAWTPDSRIIAVQEETRRELRVMNVDGTQNRSLASEWSQTRSLDYSPDGSRMKFALEGDDGIRIGIMNADGSGRRMFERIPRPNGGGFWSPDGQWIGYRTTVAGGTQVVLLNANSGAARIIGTAGRMLGPLVWRADSRSLLYNLDVGTAAAPQTELREVRTDGSDDRVVQRGDRPLIGNAATEHVWWRIIDNELVLYTRNGTRTEVVARGVIGPAGFSRDGRRFAVGVKPAPEDRSFRMIVGVDGRTTEVTLPDDLQASGGRVWWHPSGSHFLVLGCDPQCGRNNRVLAVPVGGGAPRILPVPAEQHVRAFDLSPDGRRITYVAELPPRQKLLEVDIAGWLRP